MVGWKQYYSPLLTTELLQKCAKGSAKSLCLRLAFPATASLLCIIPYFEFDLKFALIVSKMLDFFLKAPKDIVLRGHQKKICERFLSSKIQA